MNQWESQSVNIGKGISFPGNYSDNPLKNGDKNHTIIKIITVG